MYLKLDKFADVDERGMFRFVLTETNDLLMSKAYV